ncbi:phosphatidate cytidylyltransferase [Candidatus Photodesmus blepharus]|uniref:Phosphatidate cytidylyltransferase n=1 Tax=Candidatus Photodesmus blepharonis TaxID=1179155 RepID=A0A084CNX9_9GAMM|nr:phosphatidate cytidylyltransferase [Candidatus Photodesmus blepharus]KEY91508.1 phosphatidate cytidylyltransferase [Candidatus Photodesmus blepharus]
MKQRIVTALVLVPLVILGIFVLPLFAFVTTLAIITLVGFWEWTQFVEEEFRFIALMPAVVIISSFSFLLISFDSVSFNAQLSVRYLVLAIGVIWWLAASGLTVTYPHSSKFWQGSKILHHLFGILTLIPFFWSVLLLRAESTETSPYHGAKLVLFVCLIVWLVDSGAYFAGKSMGKRKMAPSVSPNKTIEGLLCGIITAGIASWFLAQWFEIEFSSPMSMMLIILVTVVISVFGDLVESMFKRVSGIKDSGNMIPGHGGVLDRIDSLTAAFPVFTLLYFIF